MQLTIRHLSGSRAGQQQTLTGNSVTLGRNPSNQVAFDPEQDRMVSGLHAELLYRDDLWILRDLGSSNGTYINDEQVSERIVRPGEVVQLGKNGPRLQLDYQSSNPSVAAGSPRPGPSVAAAPEGRTVVMMLDNPPPAGMSSAAAASMTPGMAARPRKKGGLLRALLIVGLIFGLLLVAGIGAIVMIRSRSAPTQPVVTEQQKKAAEDAARLRQQIEQKKAALVQTQADLQRAQATATDTTGTSASSMEAQDLNRQLTESQRMIEELTRQLQEKNDQMRPVMQEPPPPMRRPVVTRPESRSREEITAEALFRAQQRQQTQSPPTRVQATTQKQPPPVATRVPVTAPPTSTSPPAIALGPLTARKTLKKRIGVQPLPNEIPLPDLPDGAANDVGNLISRALISTGGFAEGENGIASISVGITNYKNDSRTNVNTKSVTSGASAVAGVFGKSVPNSPVNVESRTVSAEIAILVRVYDNRSRQIAEFQPAASTRDTKSKVDVTSLSFGQISNSDSPAGDVARQVAAEAVDGILRELQGMDWQGSISDPQDGTFSLDCGSACSVEVGDVFDVVDGSRVIGRVRVTRVERDKSFAETIFANGKLEAKGVRYAGREKDSPLSANAGRNRQLQMRTKAKAFAGPGNSFKQVKQLKEGARIRFLYSIGTWAKASDGSSTFWVPMAQAQVVS